MLSDTGVLVQFAPFMGKTYTIVDVIRWHKSADMDIIGKVPFIWLKSNRATKQRGGNVTNGYEVIVASKKKGKSTSMDLKHKSDNSNVFVAPVRFLCIVSFIEVRIIIKFLSAGNLSNEIHISRFLVFLPKICNA